MDYVLPYEKCRKMPFRIIAGDFVTELKMVRVLCIRPTFGAVMLFVKPNKAVLRDFHPMLVFGSKWNLVPLVFEFNIR